MRLLPLLLLLFASSTFAQFISIVKSSEVAIPATILTNTQAAGDYVVTNTSGQELTIFTRALPTGFSRVAAGTSSCGTSSSFVLADGASCNLRLAYSSSVATSVSQQLPTVCLQASGSYGCVSPAAPTSFTVVSADSDLPTLTAPSETVDFSPGQITTLTVRNTGNIAANNIKITLPSNLQTYLGTDAITACGTVAAGSSCSFRLPMNSNLPESTAEGKITVQGSDTQLLELRSNVQAAQALVTASAISFNQPGTKSITLSNNSSVPLEDIDIELGDGLSNVSPDEGATTCSGELAANTSCNYALTATENASGSAIATIHYTPETGDEASVTAIISVSNTTVAINPNGSGVGQDIEAETEGTNSFTVKNTGSFVWQNAAVSRDSSDSSWLTLSEPVDDPCAGAIAPGASCTVDYTLTGEHDLSGVITAAGSNLTNTSQNLEPNQYISIGVEGDSALQHLQYRAIKITNLTSLSQTLSSVTSAPPAGLATNVTKCDSTASNCEGLSAYATTCADGEVLAAGASCHIWYKANTSTTLNDLDPETVNISATATNGGSSTSLERPMTFRYANELYVVGNFTGAKDSADQPVANTTRVVKWNGSNWESFGVNKDIQGPVNTAYFWHGDLYIGGAFVDAGNVEHADYIAKWNGSDWSALGQGMVETNPEFPESSVNAITAFDNELIAAGKFNGAKQANGTVLAVKNLSRWDGNQWSVFDTTSAASRFGDSVSRLINRPLADGGSQLVLLGIEASPSFAATISAWNPTDSEWVPLVDDNSFGTFPSFSDLAALDNNFYISGAFNFNDPSEGLVRLNDENNITFDLSNQFVNALASGNGKLYAGSYDNNSFTDSVKEFNPDTPAWTDLGGSFNGSIQTLYFFGNTLYAAGFFTEEGANTVNGIASWNGTAWSPLGNGFETDGGFLLGSPSKITSAPSLILSTNAPAQH